MVSLRRWIPGIGFSMRGSPRSDAELMVARLREEHPWLAEEWFVDVARRA
jgi:hypothetical protein